MVFRTAEDQAMSPTSGRQEGTSVVVDGKVVELGASVEETLAIGDIHIVLLNLYDFPSDYPFKGRNIVALNKDGNELWRVEPFWWTVKAKDGTRKIPDSFSHIHIGDDGKLYAEQPIGFICEIDLKTGKILQERQTR